MSFRRSLILASLLAAFLPGSGLAADVGMVFRDVQVGQVAGGARSLQPRPAPVTFEMVGLHWRGPGEVWFRTAGTPGAWSAWRAARPEGEDRPDQGSPETDRSLGWKLGNPYWTGPSRFIQYRLAGRVTHLRAFFLRIPATSATSTRALAVRADRPAIVSRSQWGANESIVRGTPAYAERVRFSVVHHTAGTNRYSRGEAAGIVRGIQRYHVQGNGWNDIGYNFLVDKYGRIYEGRTGGIWRNVIGAHAQGFNTGSVGVAVLGTYGSTRISRAARSAIQRLLAWRLDVAHVDPASRLTFASYGNPRFPAGRGVRLRAVSGHRDTGYTSCPGGNLYADLGAIARSVSTIGLPKLYEPEVSGALGGPVRFTGRLSGRRYWTVTVKDGDGAFVRRGSGRGSAIEWTWDSTSAPLDSYTYLIRSGSKVHPASGVVPGPPPLAVQEPRVRPKTITPNGDGNADRARISFTLSKRANVRVTVRASGTAVRTLLDGERPGGRVTVVWDGADDEGAPLPDRRYWVRIEASAGDERVQRARAVTVDRTLAWMDRAPTAFSPDGNGRRDKLIVSYGLTREAAVRVEILEHGHVLRTISSVSRARAGTHRVTWGGWLHGRRAPDGKYTASVRATTSLGTRRLGRRFRVDTRRPRARIVVARQTRRGTRLRLRLSQSGRQRVWFGRPRRHGVRTELAKPAGTRSVWRRVRANVVRVIAWDAARNRSPAAVAQVRR
ncbi:MAG TPA: FlgD immunoglobulin-like domain containing protein [Gaiellaceae bacterium]|nr:FlgD immunoglobulin-like domain containing protein [Gaiellaceae bacterium]